MNKIVIASLGTLGDILPYISICKRMQNMGYKTLIATTQTHEDLIRNNEIDCVVISPEIDHKDQLLAQKTQDRKRGTQYVIQKILDPNVYNTYADLERILNKGDVLITNVTCIVGRLLQVNCGVYWVHTVLSPNNFWSKYDPLVPHNATYFRHLVKYSVRLNYLMIRLSRVATLFWLKNHKKLYRKIKGGEYEHPFFEAISKADYVLGLYSENFARKRSDIPPNTLITGFITMAEKPDVFKAKSLESFVNEKGGAPVIISLGSSVLYSDPIFISSLVRDLLENNKRVVVLTGKKIKVFKSDSNLMEIDYFPHRSLFKYASVVIHHGGIGTTANVLKEGKPSIVFPFSHDQPDNAYRLYRLGVGEVFLKYNKKRFFNSIEYLTSPRVQNKVMKLQSLINSERAEDTTIIALKKWINKLENYD